MALMGGKGAHHTDRRILWHKNVTGGGSVEITGLGETGVTQEERLIVLCID